MSAGGDGHLADPGLPDLQFVATRSVESSCTIEANSDAPTRAAPSPNVHQRRLPMPWAAVRTIRVPATATLAVVSRISVVRASVTFVRRTSTRPSKSRPSAITPATAATPNASQRGESSGVAWGQINVLATTNAPGRPMPV